MKDQGLEDDDARVAHELGTGKSSLGGGDIITMQCLAGLSENIFTFLVWQGEYGNAVDGIHQGLEAGWDVVDIGSRFLKGGLESWDVHQLGEGVDVAEESVPEMETVLT